MSELYSESLTWPTLLTQWVKFAQTTVAIPDDAEGPRWRASTPAIITLQAVTFALADLDRLPPTEHPLAIDKAHLLIESSRRQLAEIWGNSSTRSEALNDIIVDAENALATAAQSNFTAARTDPNREPPRAGPSHQSCKHR